MSARLKTLQEICSGCRNCTLGATRNKLVFGEGPLNPMVMFVGEGPGKEEDETGRPFVGRCGKLLRNMIIAIGLDLEKEVYIANVVKCRPPSNRPPEPEEIEQCGKLLKKQVEIIRPKRVVLLGKTAVKGLLSEHSKMTIGALRKISPEMLLFEGIPMKVTYHPSSLLRDPSRKSLAYEDFKEIESIVSGLR